MASLGSRAKVDGSVRPVIAVVGVCASGKSTLVKTLQARGYNARQVLQEHSYVRDMWQRFTQPDLLVYLDASADTIRERRGKPDWPNWLYEHEIARLTHAREFCDLYIRTDRLSTADILRQVLGLIERYAG